MSDQTNYNMSSISTLVEDLPAGVYVAGDNGFQPTGHMIPLFLGSQKLNIWNNLFNFHLSQIHMKIEQTFGIFVSQWGIFDRPLRMGLANVSTLILTATKLHNFILQGKYPEADALPSHHEIICDFGVSNVQYPFPSIPPEVTKQEAIERTAVQGTRGSSALGQVIVEHVCSNRYT